MKTTQTVKLSLLSLMLFGVLAATVMSQAPSTAEQRAKLQKDFQSGNFKDAYVGLRTLCLDPKNDPRLVPGDLSMGVQSLQRLGRLNEIDEFLESTIAVHKDNWRLLNEAASQYIQNQHQGFMIAGKYERGPHRGGGTVVNSLERDRARAMQLMAQAIPLANKDDQKQEVGQFYLQLANHLLYDRGFYEAWRLQYLSNLDELPDYDEGYPYFRSYNGAPVDEQGNAVFHHAPKSWDEAKTDGERWRWALDQAVENSPRLLNDVRWQQAQFYEQQFGVQTMNQNVFGRRFFGLPQSDDDKKDESGTYALHTLKENETIAKLATGIKRFDLPDEFNHIKLYQTIAAEVKGGHGENSLNQLAQIFENRRQYPKAAEYWKQTIEQYGPGNNNWKKQRSDQIVGNWGSFESIMTQPAGEGATVEFRFRNGKNVKLQAHAIKVDKLLDDVKAYLKSDPGRIDYQRINLGDIGYRLVWENQVQYVGEQVAAWDLALEPRENHFDRRITVATPLQKPGAYFLTATMDDGNVSKIIMWVADTAIVRKQLHGKSYYYVADSVGGKPVAGANLEFFGYQQKSLGGNRFQILTTNFAEETDADGQAMPDPQDLKTDYQWLVTARGKGDRFAYLGFQGVWSGQYYDAEYNQVKVFCITDRPVYRPEQKVHFKMWVRHAQYDQEDTSQFAKKSFPVEIFNPKGDKIYSQTLETDDYGGLEGELEIAKDFTLGQYSLQILDPAKKIGFAMGGNTFRIEEYKKPEFEVSVDAPTEPVMLGEKITAKVKAKYYFGSPVVNATVKYKVMRSDYSEDWFPIAPWDWCFGPGYWWFCYDAPWYPGWREWVGCKRPVPWWWYRGNVNPPELVAEQELPIGEDGTVDVSIDTEIAKAIHGDKDHQYTITAEVRDQSRRTIVGQGKVLVARKPFKVFSWVDRGYYRVGDVVQANFLAQTLDKKPVEGAGVLTLLKITYDEKQQPIETPVRRWDVNTNVEGRADQQMLASAKGQYRLAYKLTDSKQHTIEGGYLFTIIGEGFDGADYRFNSVELIPDKREYQPGEPVKLQINTNRVDSTVLLFVRPANGVYLPPKVLRLQGKSTVEEIAVVKKDMPNFFVEAVTVSGGRVYSETKEIVVPPEKRVLNVAVLPSAEAYKPGQKAKVKVQLTDFTGENFEGTTVVAIYDKAVEYISGGSNVPDIKEFFWKWRRHHNPNQQTSLDRFFANLTLKNQPGMSAIGVFGATVADDLESIELADEGALGDDRTKGFAEAEGRAAGFGGGPGGGLAKFARRESEMSNAMMADGAAMPMAAGAPMEKLSADKAGDAGGGAGAALVEPTVRSNFADTALWVGALTTDKTGIAEVELDMPENLTAWKISVWGLGHGTKVGSGVAEVVTRKELILRLQAPRFFVQNDEVVLSANVHNYLANDKEVTVSLEVPGDLLAPMAETTVKVMVPANGEQRVDWRVKVVNEGTATVRMKALTDEESDAMEMKLPCYVHGMLKTESWAGTVRPDQASAKVTINVPAERRVDQSLLEIRYSPTLAGAMVDALPYLADYPYGCTEQTLNRFLPTVITQKVLLEMNLNLAEIRDKRTNLNAQELGDAAERAKQWKRFDRNPVFDEDELNRMVKEGLKMLTNMQLSDGGWGWFSGIHERSWPHTTGVVVHGLQIAQQNDVPLVPGVLERGVEWLKRYQAAEIQKIKNAPGRVQPWKESADNLDAFVYMVLVDAGADNQEMRDFLYRDRNNIAVYSKAMFGLALHNTNPKRERGDINEMLDMILKNIEQYLVQDAENETAYLKLPADNYWWYWYGSEAEANAYYLKLLSRTDAKGLAAPRLVKYLLNNRKHATYWSNTRDTAVCVEAFADYIRASGETKPDMFVEIWIDGQKQKEVQITADNLFTFDNKFVLAGDNVKAGSHDVEIRRRGQGPVYFNTYLTNFTLEDPITKAGLEVKVERKYYKLMPVEKQIKVEGSRGQAVDQRVEKYQRVPLENLATLKSGDLVEIELEIESKNDYEYIIFEDMKAAGFEPVELRSGYTNNGLGAYTEFRDERVAFFVRWLARGNHSISYRLRAETPGKFSALPAKAHAMYAPELKGNSDEIKLKIED
jgi:uncharacterized protein YfaS (alpha-2-macroglobulin family)